MNKYTLVNKSLSYFAMLFSTGTLFCCVIPATLVVLGFGTVMASLVVNFQWLIVLSDYKFFLLLISGLLILTSHWLFDRGALTCTSIENDENRQYCQIQSTHNKWILNVSECIWYVSFMMAYIIMPLIMYIDNLT